MTLDDLRQQLRRVVKKRGVYAVAADIPADRKTLYRYLSGRVDRPSLAVREGIERVVERFGGQVPRDAE